MLKRVEAVLAAPPPPAPAPQPPHDAPAAADASAPAPAAKPLTPAEQEELQRIRNLSYYRHELAKLQAQAPNGVIDMPGFTPELIAEREKTVLAAMPLINYSNRYRDMRYEYRHVILPKSIARWVPEHIMSDTEWRSLGVLQSYGWVHYMIHKPEPHVLLFRRNLPPPEPAPPAQPLPQ